MKKGGLHRLSYNPASIYEKLACPAPVFAKWLYEQGISNKKAVCVGCDKECQLESMEGFLLETQHKSMDYKAPYAISPIEMVRRHVLLNAKTGRVLPQCIRKNNL